MKSPLRRAEPLTSAIETVFERPSMATSPLTLETRAELSSRLRFTFPVMSSTLTSPLRLEISTAPSRPITLTSPFLVEMLTGILRGSAISRSVVIE